MKNEAEKTKHREFKWKSLLRILLLIICGAAVGINVYLLNANTVVGNRLPMPFGYGAAVVLSGSMEPTLSTGDLIIVNHAGQLSVGDIVVYQDGDILVVHRIIVIDGETVTTKGDANSIADEPVSISEVKGRVVSRIPFVGRIVNLIKSPLGTVLIIIAAIALVELPHRKERQKNDEEQKRIIDEIERLKSERKD